MKATELNTSLIESYFTMLKHLSPNIKLELIAKLSTSMQNTAAEKDTSWKALFGSLKLEKSPDEFVDDLKRERNFRRDAPNL